MQIFIYSRKSKWTGRGESIENQVQMCREYIERGIPEAAKAEIRVFEDEGYSGKNTRRPEFQRMMQELKKGECKYLVCYKLDRMGRSIIDIAGLVEELNRLQVSFISIKENFDTSTPLGKTMLYIAGIFAQMEREQIAERVKDNMVMLARSGRWLGGNTPLGFSSQKEERVQMDEKVRTSYRLIEKKEELLTVHFIFEKYLEKQSLTKVVEYFQTHGIRTKRGKEYTTTAVRAILTNPVYCVGDGDAYDYFEKLGCQLCFEKAEADGTHGLIAYGKTSSAQYKNKDNPPEEWILALGKHRGEISGAAFRKVQEQLLANQPKSASFHKVKNEIALLSGILYCKCGHVMRPKYYSAKQLTKEGERKFSYLCPYKEQTHKEQCSVENVPGNELDRMVCRELLEYAKPDSAVNKLLLEKKSEIRKEREIIGEEDELLHQAVEEKENSLRSLLVSIQKPGRSPEFIKQVEEEVTRLSRECRELRQKEIQWEKEKEAQQKGKEHIFEHIKNLGTFLLDELDTFAKVFRNMEVSKKREYLKMLLEKVVWDGETAHIFLRGSDPKE